jgi:hypothetical protein
MFAVFCTTMISAHTNKKCITVTMNSPYGEEASPFEAHSFTFPFRSPDPKGHESIVITWRLSSVRKLSHFRHL